MYKTFEYAVGESWLVGMYGNKAVYTIKKAEFRARDRKEIYTVDVDGTLIQFTKNRLHFLLHFGVFKKLKSGTYSKYKIPEPPASVIRGYYAQMRAKEAVRLERMNDKLGADARYQKIQQEISVLSHDIAKAEFNRGDAFEIRILKTKLDAAKRERAAILALFGMDQAAMQKKVQCKACGDMGYLPNGKPCECVEKHLSKIMEYWEKSKDEKGERKAR